MLHAFALQYQEYFDCFNAVAGLYLYVSPHRFQTND